jgi:mannobiose 2-epimerase
MANHTLDLTAGTIDDAVRQDARQRMEQELLGNILPFWIEHTIDKEHGGFYGALTNDLRVLNDVPRSAVLCGRIMWTFAAAHRAFEYEEYRAMAQRAYEYLTQVFWDREYGGLYWAVDKTGAPTDDRKHSYAQAFAIYGLAEYYAATGEPESLRLARTLFELLETYAHDDTLGGYTEGRARDWSAGSDMRLDGKDPNYRKSMNTLLHVMEAYTALLRVWEDGRLRTRLEELIGIFLQHVIDPRTHHLHLFFDDQLNALGDDISYGHDIEASWLLVEAAEVLGSPDLLARARAVAVEMAEAVYTCGLDSDGSMLYEGDQSSPKGTDKHWWPQAEGVVGFYNAYQLSGRSYFVQAALGCWQYIEEKLVDQAHGDWFKVLNRQGVPYPNQHKVGPWECPYHHSRTCLEMLRRLA